MAEAAEPCLDLEVERDNLREELQFVLTDLKKLDYDLADLNRDLLTDKSAATVATNSRISIRLRSLQDRLKKLKEPTETPSPPAQTAASRTAASNTATAIVPTYGRLRMHGSMKQSKYMRSEQNAMWAWRVIVSQDRPVVSIGWLEQHWDSIPNETAPLWIEFASKDIKNGYLELANIFAAAEARDLDMIEIGRKRARSADTSGRTSKRKLQNHNHVKFTNWAVSQLRLAGPGMTQKDLLSRNAS